MQVVVPFAPDAPKTRLGPVLGDEERAAFARAMLDDVLDAVERTGRDPIVLSTEAIDCNWPVRVDDRPLSPAVNAVLESAAEPVAIVMADLALVTPDALDRLFDATGDVVVAPGRGGGTNALVVRHPEFRVDYHGCSYCDHRDIASDLEATTTIVDSYRLSTDVDEPDDLVEVLLHGGDRSAETLRAFGIERSTANGRVQVTRREPVSND